MGARTKGDIKAIAQMVKPKYGVLTGVNNQHLETFGSIENTMDTKFELFENLANGGIGIFSSDNQNAIMLKDRFDGEKYSAGLSGEDCLVTATDVKTDDKGMTFMLNVQGERPVKCSTVLLGKHSVRNICIASAVAYKMGLTVKEISAGINRIQSIGHRLELIPNNKKIVIIDDSYFINHSYLLEDNYKRIRRK
jgi:UDP-N-acetylmuramoyl-tripeptide--D-alanyl-D-alanine ligase